MHELCASDIAMQSPQGLVPIFKYLAVDISVFIEYPAEPAFEHKYLLIGQVLNELVVHFDIIQ